MKCFYHKTDLDGHCSGAIVKLKYPDCEMIGVDYSDDLSTMAEFGEIVIDDGETVFVVDFSFDREDMEFLKENTDLHWIDHHKSALEEKLKGFECKGKQEIGKAGCELTWDYLHPYASYPVSVWLLGRYDVWDHENPDVLPFQYGMRSLEETLPGNDIWDFLINGAKREEYIKDLIDRGNMILDYENKQNEMYARGMAYEAEFEGLRAIVINKAFCNSKIFDSVYDTNLHDLMIVFGVKPGQIKYTLYSTKDDVDVSKLAMKYDGGGHKGAAGFYSKTLIV